MDFQNNSSIFSDYQLQQSRSHTVSKTFMANVFAWMFGALMVSTICAFLFSTNETLLSYLINGRSYTPLGLAVVFAPLAFVLLMSFGYNKLSAPIMAILFIAFAAINGISLSFILLRYTSGSVLGAFASAAAMFGVMAVMGYTTNKDLTSFGRILTMGFYGIIIALLINIFLHSSAIDYLISMVGVAVFTGLTAYDVQKLKQIGMGIENDGSIAVGDAKKMSIYGALTLYLDFINLFLMLLRLFGGRRK